MAWRDSNAAGVDPGRVRRVATNNPLGDAIFTCNHLKDENKKLGLTKKIPVFLNDWFKE
jgi:hypothetical protein